MPITLLDILLLVVMLISGLLAMIRGFMREILSIAAWAIAALVTLYSYSRALPIAQGYFSSNTVAAGVTVGSIFLVTLLIVSIITVRVSDMILDSRVGALDRTLGFLFGLGRGLLIVVVAYVFFDWLVPTRQPTWISGAKSVVVLKSTGNWLLNQLPGGLDETIFNKLKPPKPSDQDARPDAGPGQRSELDIPAAGDKTQIKLAQVLGTR